MKSNCILLLFFIGMNSICAQEKLELFFDFAIDVPDQNSSEKLTHWLENSDSVKVTKIEGFCDHADSDAYNKDLSLRRANAVLAVLQSADLNLGDIEVVGFGENFKQSKIQSENRKVIVYYEPISTGLVEVPAQKSRLTRQIAESKAGETYKLENLNFYDMSDRVVPNSRPVLMELLQIMKDNESLQIEIQGHICCMTVDKYQTAKSRALRVYNYLVYNGIDKNRLTCKSFGSSRPIHALPETTEAQKDANRRVEIMVISK